MHRTPTLMNNIFNPLLWCFLALTTTTFAQPDNTANFDTTQCINNNGLPNFCFQAGYEAGQSQYADTVYVCDYISYALAIEAMSLEVMALQAQLAACQDYVSTLPDNIHCPTDLDNNGTTGTSDLITLLSNFEVVCN